MNFKSYLTELNNIEVGQAIEAHEPSGEASSSVVNPVVLAQVNQFLDIQFREKVLTAEDGISRIRKSLHRFGFDLPALYEADTDGDEVVFDIHQFGIPTGPTPTNTNVDHVDTNTYLYVIYYLTDDGYYDFLARVTDEAGLNELLETDEEEDEEED